MRAWPIVLKSLGYLWLIIEIVVVQYAIVFAIHDSYIKGLSAPEMSFGYIAWIVIVATPGVALLVVAEKLKTKRNDA